MEELRRTERIRVRDPQELQQVVSEQLPALLRGARATGLDRARAEEAVQAALLIFLEKADQFDGRARVGTWLFGILYKKIAETRRSAARQQQLEDIDAVMEQRFDANGAWAHPPLPADSGLVREEIRRWIEECMDTLPERHRLAFVLREVEQLKTVEICKILEVTADNLGVILYRGRNSLRECLEARGIRRSSDAAL